MPGQAADIRDVYGLAEDPFALPTPPAPGDRLWCFIDRGLDERSTGRTLKGVIEQFTTRVLSNKAGSRGLLIIGKWGSGKTHSLNAIEHAARSGNARVSRTSVRDDA